MIDYTQDILYRDVDVNNIVKMINLIMQHEKKSFIMIDGEWGSGKSTLLDMIEKRLENEIDIIKYNCWENSYYDDPLMSILSIMYDTIQSEKIWTDKDREKFENLIKIPLYLLTLGNMKMFNIPSDLYNDLKQNKLKTISSQIDEIKKYFQNIESTMLIIVDEVDRCLPEYAIKVLERLYLIFKNIPNVIVLIANNNKQLNKSIKRIYGDDIDVDKYLKKFIDETYTINYNSINYSNLYTKYKKYFEKFSGRNNGILRTISEIFSTITPREQEQIINKLTKVHSVVFGSEKPEFYVSLSEILMILIDNREIISMLKDNINGRLSKELLNILQKNYKLLSDYNYTSGMMYPQSEIAKSLQLTLFVYYKQDYEKFKYIIREHHNFIVNCTDEDLAGKIQLFIDEYNIN